MRPSDRSLAARAFALGALTVLVALTAPAAVHGQSPQDLVRRAVEAMGGESRLRGLANSTVDFTSVTYGLGQQAGSHAPARGTFFTGRIVSDFARSRRMIAQEARPTPAFVMRLRVLADGAVGMSEQNGRLVPAGPAQVENLQRELRLEPAPLLLAALDAPAAVSAVGTRDLRGLRVPGVRYAGRDTVIILFDPMTALPIATEIVSDDPILGDRTRRTLYSTWRDAGGVMIARQVDVELNGVASQHIVVGAATVNGTLADSIFAIPDSIRRRPGTPAAAAGVSLVEVAPRVWRAEGGSHFSLVVEQGSQLVLFEAPLDAQRTRAVLDTLAARFPGKGVGVAVASHHHWDHAGGLRAVMAAGIPVAVHARHAAFVEGIAAAPKTAAPDALSRSRRRAAVRPVADSLTIGRGDERVEFHTLPNTHAEGLLVAYVPASRILFVVDVLSPGPGAPPRAASAEIVAFVRSRGLAVDRVVGGHGGIVDYAALERAVAP